MNPSHSTRYGHHLAQRRAAFEAAWAPLPYGASWQRRAAANDDAPTLPTGPLRRPGPLDAAALHRRAARLRSRLIARAIVRGLRHCADVFGTWQERVASRHQLAELGDHALRDIGLTRADAVRESAKPFWIG